MMATLIAFTKTEEFAQAVVQSTQAGFGGSGYSVEIFPDGGHRVLADMEIGNLYRSPGMIVRIPQLSGEEVSEADDEAGLSLLDVAKFYQDELAAQMIELAAI